MDPQSKKHDLSFNEYTLNAFRVNENEDTLIGLSRTDILKIVEKIDAVKTFFQQKHHTDLDEKLTRTVGSSGKKSFLVFKHNKYITVSTESIGFFYVRHESTIIVCLDGQEYIVSHSLEQIQNLLNEKQFYRLNRQYLINFSAVKEVEHYFARKLLVKLSLMTPDKLLVRKEKATSFLHWLENR